MSGSEAEQAAAVVGALAGGRLVVVPADDGDPAEVPASVVDVVREVLDHLRRGERVRVVPEDVENHSAGSRSAQGVAPLY